MRLMAACAPEGCVWSGRVLRALHGMVDDRMVAHALRVEGQFWHSCAIARLHRNVPEYRPLRDGIDLSRTSSPPNRRVTLQTEFRRGGSQKTRELGAMGIMTGMAARLVHRPMNEGGGGNLLSDFVMTEQTEIGNTIHELDRGLPRMGHMAELATRLRSLMGMRHGQTFGNSRMA